MNIVSATREYESWLSGRISIVQADLAAKHACMKADLFSFLRGTFYRWAQLFPGLCPQLVRAPKVLAVGDVHLENYGTWRDSEGRLVWGINDFDEVCPLPYTNDLVRLATSAWLAIGLHGLAISHGEACAAILDGYWDGLVVKGRPFVLSERNRWLRDAVTSRLRDPTRFWEKLLALPLAKNVPPSVRALLATALPERGLAFSVAHRRSGVGSLGRPRFTAVAEWRGGKVAREAKALIPSAWWWAHGLERSAGVYFNEIVRRAVRAHDPFLRTEGKWILRRLSPYCSRIELRQMPRGRDEGKLLWGMGLELANVHLGTPGAATRIRADLRRRKAKWLQQSAQVLAEATVAEWKEWKRGH
jgi:uncharacterized protein (DUF2252 family)